MVGPNSRCLWLWQLGFGVSLPATTSNFSLCPQHPSHTEMCSTMRESIRPSSFYNPTLSEKKHVVQFCSFWLSAAAVGLADCSGERRTSPFNGDAQSWNGFERSLSRAVVPQSLPFSATTFLTVLSMYIAQGRLRNNIRCPSCSQRQNWNGKIKKKLGLFFLLEARQRNGAGWPTSGWPANAKLQLFHRYSTLAQSPSSLSLHACMNQSSTVRFLAPTSALEHLSRSTLDWVDHSV